MADQSKTPFFSALLAYAKSDITCFDVPGHRMGQVKNEFSDAVGEMTMRMDVNAPRGLDNLSKPNGVIKEAENLMAEAFKADRAHFLINGTSSGIITSIMASVKAKDKIILPRNVHKSMINALILSGAIPVFVEPQVDEQLGIANNVTYEAYRSTIADNCDAKAVFIINPTYFGVAVELAKLIDLIHEHNMIAIVDEAHGAHFCFHETLPLAAMEAGADITSISMHKTGGSLTQSSALLVKGDRVRYAQVQKISNILQTTSPSCLLMGSLDVARKTMFFEGHERLEKVLHLSKLARGRINKIPGLFTPDKNYFKQYKAHYDETKLIIQVNNLGLTGFEVYNLLRDDYNIQMELAETYVVLAVLSIGTTKAHLDKLIRALRDISSKHYGIEETIIVPKFKFNFPEMIIRPREAYNAPKKRIIFDNAVGEICGEQIMAYPPGIPLIIPGEVITKEVIDRILFYESKGTQILSEFDDDTINVIDQKKWKRGRNKYAEI